MSWQKILKSNFTKWEELIAFLEIPPSLQTAILKSSPFPLNLPKRLAEKIKKGRLDDPILRQFVPLQDEQEDSPGFLSDPVGDLQVQCTPNLLQKYEGRALLVSTSACAMHCRFCFRQNYPYDSKNKSYDDEIQLLERDSSITELILSGGDPLSLPNRVLADLFNRLKKISHLKRLRFHTRFPIGIPERIDEGLLTLLSSSPFQIWFVLHVNHPLELDEDLFFALKKLQKLSIPLLTQTVLLKGVNDTGEVLLELFEKLINRGILPYYLHQLDRVKGAHHFDVEEEEGHRLIKYLEENLPGYGVPKYVREISGKRAKTRLHPLEGLNS